MCAEPGQDKMFSCIRVGILGCVVMMVLVEVAVLVRVEIFESGWRWNV